ncbi:MAG: 5-formyltetrahydrofolate cyclo-ligase [Gammaproteobacteria bacterium]|nr:5-formyltetrahydrofolate cyclo-ligase [Gammaproteobacteria bacterium]
MNAKALRQQIREQRRALSDAEREDAAFLLCERIASSHVYQQSKHIAFYLPNDGEMDLRLLIEHAWQQGKYCYLPVLAEPNTQRLWFIPYTAETKLKPNRFGIPEPIHPHSLRIRKTLSLDLILMPLVAFDEKGNRIGMGGGFYDRTLAFLRQRQYWHKPKLLGVAYDFQKQKQLQKNPWDIPLQTVATERHLYLCNKKNA